MFAPKFAATALSVLLVAAAVGPAATGVAAGAAASSQSQQGAYAGTHVSFETESDAVVDYAVDGETVLESVRVQSKSEAQSAGGLSTGIELSAVTSVDGSAVSVDARSETSARVTAESGAELRAHDNARGILTVSASDGDQYATVGLPGSAEAEAESGDRVVVTTENGTQGAFLVVGDGTVAVNDEGNVSAEIAEGGKLVFRAYGEERGDDDAAQERLIRNGTAAAEVYVSRASDGSGETVADVVRYGEDISVEVTQRSEAAVTMTVERSAHQGKVVIASVSDAVIDAADDVRVKVDGETAARASSYGELRSAADGGDVSKFMVEQRSGAEAGANVLVAVNHFSSRQITVEETSTDSTETATGGDAGTTESDGTTAESGTDASATDGDATADEASDESTSEGAGANATAPGFGFVAAVLSLLGAALFAGRRP